ncbi:conserved hypothetical protein [Trichinella spiralis]|uniref:hypothetical protein n=1 Tax=Trichinella spiralis TaxID=6334 RepID=UPI0001EFD159|nr:conserved hypothetical protein [Trichinella spiralis]
MKHSCDVCFTTTGYDIDEVVLDYWIAGYDDIDYGCMLAEVEDAFRLFQLTSKYMESPPRLCEQRLLPLTTPMCEMLISKRYALAIFMCTYRFEFPRKRLGYLSFDDLCVCCIKMINCWSNRAFEEMETESDIWLSREFLASIKDAKILCERSTIDELKNKIALFIFVIILKSYCKVVINIGMELSQVFFLDYYSLS